VLGERLRPRAELLYPAAGSLALLLVVAVAVQFSDTLALELSAVLLVLIGSVAAYLSVPHRALAGTIALFALLPALKEFISPSIGGLKDVIDLGAIIAGAILIGFERRRLDRWIATLVALFMALYVFDIGGGHGSNWIQGVRLVGEPMLLLVVGCVLPDPRRNLRWAFGAFAATGVFVAFYGILQQAIGINGLVSLGYVYGEQVRQVGSMLRSFGTLDDPFNYAAFLYVALASAFWVLRRGWLLWVVEAVLLLGLLVSFVRTAALILLGFVTLAAIHRRLTYPALCLIAATAVIAGLTLSKSTGVQTEALTVFYRNGGSAVINRAVNVPSNVLLNGRVSAWTAAVGNRPVDWIFGRGVGQVGTIAQRAAGSTTSSSTTTSNAGTSAGSATTAVDSGYLATVADVGIIGLLVELALFARIFVLGARRVRAGSVEGWIPLSILLALMLDALTRASFTGFPTAFLGFFIVGIALAALDAPQTESEERSRPRSRGGSAPTIAPRAATSPLAD
jgi:uncharacterized membrane protein YhaH (DUF805 family)